MLTLNRCSSLVEWFIFLKNREVYIAHFTKKILMFDNKRKVNSIIFAAIGDSNDYNIFSIEDILS